MRAIDLQTTNDKFLISIDKNLVDKEFLLELIEKIRFDYFIEKDEETNEIYLIGRFKSKGVAEIWQNGKWVESSTLHSSMLDGLLEDISEAEAIKLIAQKESQDLQAA